MPSQEGYVVNGIYDLSPEFLSDLKLWIEQSGIAIPLSQLVGFTQFVAQGQTGAGTSTTSITYAPLNGPSLTGLSPGKYLLIYGLGAVNGVSDTLMGISVNGDTPLDSDSVRVSASGDGLFAATIRFVTLTANSNSLAAMYRCPSGGSGFADGWLLALRYA